MTLLVSFQEVLGHTRTTQGRELREARTHIMFKNANGHWDYKQPQ
jgi:hypothetical protein